jgi:hypothetical protein
VVDHQLRPTVEQLGECPLAAFSLEAVVLLDRDPGQLAALQRELVSPAGQLLLLL